ncbi:hypothetical protein M378DRAFT_159876 [Amanita muscaria Koide BX008]|uniref:Uncharacterized protein n=1 Tax=Amanita muscaria (strain Koide BX008) TaxID=946122 RepID=A0A0C2XDM8_AMAMK|nr:hypothetical protein M378DRAFT_159876 [Amanita muscaria Koide BX008]
MSEPKVYIKGYKVDRDKLKAMYGSREDDPENTRFLAIWEKFPLHFKYLGNGREPDENISLVLVLEDGYDREGLENTVIPSLIAPYTKVFTPGIWVRI